MEVLKLNSVEIRRLGTDQLFLVNLLHGNVDSSRLLEHISFHVTSLHPY